MSRRSAQKDENQVVPRNSNGDKPTAASIEATPPRKMLLSIQEFGHRKLPFLFPDPEEKKRLSEERARDDRDNAGTQPPTDELVDFRCIWAVEFYTPSHSSSLFLGIEELGWNTDRPTAHSNPALWIERQRESSLGGGWLNLGILRRPEKAGSSFSSRPTPLPPGIEYAIGSVYSLTPSISCVIICFVLDESLNKRYLAALQKDRQTQRKPLRGGGYQIIGPESQKAAHVRDIRTEVRQRVSGWFRTHLPGIFSTESEVGIHPTCEFLTLRKTEPFPEQGTNVSRWLRPLNLGSWLDVWEADEVTGLKFVYPLTSDRNEELHSMLVAKEELFTKELMAPYRAGSRSSIIAYVDTLANSLLTRWALVGLLTAYERYLSRLRDSFSLRQRRKSKLLKQFSNLSRHFYHSIDISAVCVELRRFANDAAIFDWNVAKFQSCRPWSHQEKRFSLGDALRHQTKERANWIVNIDKSMRTILIQYGNALGTHENIRLQRRVALLTWLLAALTIVIVLLTVITTLVSLESGEVTLLSWVSQLWSLL